MAKKIGAIVSLSIIGILILATIIMANINVNYGIKCATPPHVYVSYNTNDPNAEVDADTHSNKIVGYINKASNEKALTALFNQTLGKKAEIKAVSEKTIASNTGFYVRYRYDNVQKLMDGKKAFKDSNGENVYFNDLVFTVNDLDGINVVKVYVIQDSTRSDKYTYYYELEADFENLYNYLFDNFSEEV